MTPSRRGLEHDQQALHYSIEGLRDEQPLYSSATTMTRGQAITLLTVVVALVAAAVVKPVATGVTLVSAATVLYLANLIDRLLLFIRGVGSNPEFTVSDEEARSIPDDQLPTYTVLVPAFQEPSIVGRLVDHLGALEYPPDRLEIKLLLEADDTETIEAVFGHPDRSFLEVVLVPAAEPRTKPKACNYGLYGATSELITIYDAEDIPEPLQLRRVAAVFRQATPEVICVQAKLRYHNETQNRLTRWFSSEYNQWFGYTLPGLMRSNAPIPLGGTSNHCKTADLRLLGGWDPFNVTEDADLGIRMARQGYRTAVLDSVTLEEANSDPINWIRQRSRWYKGYLQTFLVHTRQPRLLVRQLGWRRALRFASVTAGTPVIALINVIFWSLTLAWEVGEPSFIRTLFPWFIFYPAILSLVAGNFSMIYCGLIAARVDRRPQLISACLSVPVYWLLMSVAAVKAFVQLLFQPSYWEKTAHGLDTHQRSI
jgi:cellulose synthase/poly-beta-1,6-N-acetylglucosamine synthase-like glycosyltransferase